MKTSKAKLSRRNFLLGVGAGAATGAAALATRKETDAGQAQDSGIQAKKGYQLTEHVRNYYRTAKI